MTRILAALLLLSTAPAYADITPQTETEINALVDRWNDYKNDREQIAPESLYADRVDFYGTAMTLPDVAQQNAAFVKKNAGFSQIVVSGVTLSESEGDQPSIIVTFVKQAGFSRGKDKNYPAQLTVIPAADGWRISAETDWITLSNQRHDTALVAQGKFDGEHKGYAWVHAQDPRTGGTCQEEAEVMCQCQLWHSDVDIQPVTRPQCTGASVETLSGLDGTQRDRVLLYPEWWTSGWRVSWLYDIQQGQWIMAIPPFQMQVDVLESLGDKPVIAPVAQKPGFVRVISAEFNEEEGGGKPKELIVPLRKLE